MSTGRLLNIWNFHKKRILVTGAVVPSYFAFSYFGRGFDSEIVRIGIAGSIATMSVECGFHFVDTVNIRAKASTSNASTMQTLNKIWVKEGVIGFGRGFSATFYGAAITGFLFFMAYKKIKNKLKER